MKKWRKSWRPIEEDVSPPLSETSLVPEGCRCDAQRLLLPKLYFPKKLIRAAPRTMTKMRRSFVEDRHSRSRCPISCSKVFQGSSESSGTTLAVPVFLVILSGFRHSKIFKITNHINQLSFIIFMLQRQGRSRVLLKPVPD